MLIIREKEKNKGGGTNGPKNKGGGRNKVKKVGR